VVTKADANSDPIITVSVQSTTMNAIQLSEYAENVLQEKLQTIPGVSAVGLYGQKRPAMRLWLNPKKMAAFNLTAEDVNWNTHTISYCRKKLKSRPGIKPALIRFGEEVVAILKRRPQTGPLFPYLRTVRAGDRATEFKQRCEGLKIKGVTLHSYRYAWAERALQCGYPERFAQQALGHNSKAVHHAYSKHAEVTVPSLDDWEKQWEKNPQGMEKPKVVAVDFQAPQSSASAEPPATGLAQAS